MQDSLQIYRQLVAKIREEITREVFQTLRGVPRVISARRPVARVSPAPAVPPLPSSGRRSKADMAKTVEAVRAYVARHPGQSKPEIAKGLGVAIDQLHTPLDKLKASKVVVMKGTRKQARYSIK